MKAQNIILEASKSVETAANGLIGINPNNKEYGSIQMATSSFSFGKFAGAKRTVHFMAGRVSDLESIVKMFDLKVGDDFSAKVQPSRIIVKESTTPFYEGQPAKVNPSSGEVCTFKGEDIYRQTDLVPADSQLTDSLLTNDKAEVIVTVGADGLTA